MDNLENGVRKSSETMDDLENVPDKVNFVPCVKWVRRGKAKARPDKVQLDQSELAAIIEELDALVDRQTLMEMYRMATSDKHGFLYVNLLNERDQMFYKGFDQRFVLSE